MIKLNTIIAMISSYQGSLSISSKRLLSFMVNGFDMMLESMSQRSVFKVYRQGDGRVGKKRESDVVGLGLGELSSKNLIRSLNTSTERRSL